MSVDSKRQVALEFGYDNSLISLALKKRDFASAAELIDYIDKHEADLENEVKENQEREASNPRIETEYLLRSKHCVMCVRQPRNIITLPCAHFCLCNVCGKQCKFCPISNCKQIIRHVFSVYLC